MLNVLLARPIFSPTDFIQIKGRGTRLFTFEHEATGRSAGKDGFALFDFFANCEFFEEEFDYDEKLKLPKGPPVEGQGGGGGGGGIGPDIYTNTAPDPIATVADDSIGDDGMRIDREMYRQRFATQAQEVAASHPELREAVEAGDWAAAEALVSQLLMEKPEDFWNLVKLQKVFRSDRNPTLREILKVIFGLLPGVATREQLVAERFERFVATEPVDATCIREFRQVFESFLLDGEVIPTALQIWTLGRAFCWPAELGAPITHSRAASRGRGTPSVPGMGAKVQNKRDVGIRQWLENGEFARLRAKDLALSHCVKTLGPERLQSLFNYIRAEIPLDDFADVA